MFLAIACQLNSFPKKLNAGIAQMIIFADQTTKSINYITSPEGLTAIEITSTVKI